jgi:hypothetical protein
MSERALERRLRAVARALDADAPAFDPALLPVRRRVQPAAVAIAVVAALAAVGVAPTAVAAFDDLFGVDAVSELGQPPPDVVPPILGRRVALADARAVSPFALRALPSLGAPDAAYVRDDVTGGMVTLAYGQTLLTQWPWAAVRARVAVVPDRGVAERVTIGQAEGLWSSGAARGTYSLVGADGAIHRETFDVAGGALLWRDGDVALLLQGAGAKERAVRLAAQAKP